MNNPSNPVYFVIGRKGTKAIHAINVEFPNSEMCIRAVMMNLEEDAIIEVCEANDDETMVEHLLDNYGIDANVTRQAIKYRRNFANRMYECEKWNDEQAKSAGTMSQFEAGTVIYSVISHAPRRTAHPTKETTESAGYLEVVLQRIGEDPDDAFISSETFDTLYEAVTNVRNHIERDLFRELADGKITV